MKSRLLALAALTLAMACEGTRQPTGVTAPTDPSKIISDGAHCGTPGIVCNPDFFFLPPMVPLPLNNPNFELGKFNNTLQRSLTITICELQSTPVNSQGLPTSDTQCKTGPALKTFAAGTVQLVNLPLRQTGWWTLFNLPADGFYYVLWDTRQSNLSVSKFYRINVFLDGSTTALGVADVDPMSSLREWRYTLTGDVVQLVDDVMLPIPFRVEHGGGPAVCGTATVCNSATVSNFSPTGIPQVVTVDGGTGAIAGASFPDGWLPTGTGRPQSVVVTISQVDVGTTNRAAGREAIPCHPDLTFMQFPGCFKFTTTPALQPISDGSSRQFVNPVTGAVCYVLQGSGDFRERFAEMYASGPNEAPHPLEDTEDAGILSPATRNCSPQVFASANRNTLTRLASAGWRTIKSGLGQFFGVKTAYGVDLGLGGLMTEFSNVGAAVPARIEALNTLPATVFPGAGPYAIYVRAIGSHDHSGEGAESGIGGVPVTFTIPANAGAIRPSGNLEAAPATQLTATTNPSQLSGPNTDGWVEVAWTFPTTPGPFTLAATAPANGGPVQFSTTVVPFPLNFVAGDWVNENPSTGNNTRDVISVDGSAVSVHAWGACSPTDCDWGPTTGDTSRWLSNQEITAVWDQGFAISTQTITFLAGDRLRITTHYDFTEADGRTDFSATEFFSRAAIIQ